jgi:hypothetical protein
VRLVLVLVLVACGRVHFEPPPQRDGAASEGAGGGGGGGGSMPTDALVVDDSGTALGCGFIPCDAGATACCTAGVTSCTPDGTCSGTTYQCGMCPKFMGCCMGSSGTFCAGTCF